MMMQIILLFFHQHCIAPFHLLSFLSVAMIAFYVLSERLRLKRKGLYDTKVASLTKKEYGFGVHFL